MEKYIGRRPTLETGGGLVQRTCVGCKTTFETYSYWEWYGKCLSCGAEKKIAPICSKSCDSSYVNLTKVCTKIQWTCSHCTHGSKTCSDCNGTGKETVTNPCPSHQISGEHFYCTSNSHHGNIVGQYHK